MNKINKLLFVMCLAFFLSSCHQEEPTHTPAPVVDLSLNEDDILPPKKDEGDDIYEEEDISPQPQEEFVLPTDGDNNDMDMEMNEDGVAVFYHTQGEDDSSLVTTDEIDLNNVITPIPVIEEEPQDNVIINVDDLL